MIKFFRTIRKDLMEQNKTGKYFKYAIGEIVLVVIGILIALSINNWNEERKDRITEVKYLNGIKDDLKKDLIFLFEIEKDLESRIQRQRLMDSLLRENQIEEKHMSELKITNLRRAPTTFLSTAGNYKSMVSEGKVGLILNRVLFNRIQDIYERAYPRIEKRGDRLDDIGVKIVWQHRKETYDRRFSLEALKKSGYAEDIAVFFSEIRTYIRQLMKPLELDIQEVIKMIDQEIETI